MFRSVAAAALAAALLVPATEAQAQNLQLKMSVPAPRTQVRSMVAAQFADEIAKRSGGRVAIEIFYDSQLFRGAEEPKALASGAVDFATPNLALIGSIEPNADLLAMPSFVGATGAQVRAVMDGPVGRELAERLERTLRVKVIGGGFEFQPDVLVAKSRDVKALADASGLKIRVPGGPKYAARLKTLGTIPTFMPFEDLHLALSQGAVDGLLTNPAGIVQGKFWEVGVKHGLDVDMGWSVLYPIMSSTAWGRLGAANQKLVTDTWAEMLPRFRAQQDEQIAKIKQQLADAGIVFRQPSAAEVEAFRAKLAEIEPALASETKMDPEFVKKAAAALQAARSR